MTTPTTRSPKRAAASRSYGFRGVWRRPEHFGPLPRLQDEAYEPLWSYLEEVDVPFAHPPRHERARALRRAAQSRFDDYYTPLHAAHFVTEQMLALTTFVAYGILERHPRLRVARPTGTKYRT